MKQLLCLLAFTAFSILTAQAQGPVMTFEVTTIDYGQIDKGADPVRHFNFTKTATLTTNETEPTHTLTVKGEVKAPPMKESVPGSSGAPFYDKG